MSEVNNVGIGYVWSECFMETWHLRQKRTITWEATICGYKRVRRKSGKDRVTKVIRLKINYGKQLEIFSP